MSKLLYVGQQVADFLADNVEEHVERYTQGDFLDLESRGDWRIPLSIDVDVSAMERLLPDNSPEAEIENAVVVGEALAGLTPSLARENRIWVRLSHIEGLRYCRKRWLQGVTQEKLPRIISAHFFAPTWTACRDDHGISRLWWNYRIAQMLTPEDPRSALSILLHRADIRSGFVERSGIGARLPLARSILKAVSKNSVLMESQSAFRRFMKAVNLRGAGIVFEVLPEARVDAFVGQCMEAALGAGTPHENAGAIAES